MKLHGLLLLTAALLVPMQVAADPFGVVLAENRVSPAVGVGTLAIDGTPTQFAGTTQAINSTLTTSSSNDVCIALVRSSAAGITSPTVSGITSASGMTWAQRGSYATYSSPTVNISEWYAVAPSPLTADTLTVTMNSAASYGSRVMAFCVSGANTSSPFDPNVSLPVSGTMTTGDTSKALTFATTKNAAFVISFLSSTSALGTVTRSASFSAIAASGSTSADYGYRITTSAMASSSRTWSWTTAVAGAGALWVDAIQASGQ
jgi:hypothetical protein